MSTNAIEKTGNTLGTLQRLLETHKQQIAAALPEHITPERMIRVALTAVSSTPKLMECPPLTIAAAIMQASSLGLEPSSLLGEAYLVPYWSGRMKRTECQLIVGYQGLMKLARQSGDVAMIDAQIVYANDTFDCQKGAEVWWVHKWARSGDRGAAEGVWAGYALKDGSRNFEYWPIEQIEQHRARYCKNSVDREGNLTGPWRDSPEWMWKKTVLRQLVKLMPKAIEKPAGRALATAVAIDERSEAGVAQVYVDVPQALLPEPEPEAPPAVTPRRKSTPPAPPDEAEMNAALKAQLEREAES